MGVLVAIRGLAAGNRHTCWWECHLYYTHTPVGALTHMLKGGGQVASALFLTLIVVLYIYCVSAVSLDVCSQCFFTVFLVFIQTN